MNAYRRNATESLAEVVRRGRAAARRAPAAAARPLRELTEFGANPGELRGFLHLPDGLAPGAALVVALHGCGQTAAGYDRGTGWSVLSERLGFALLLPEQVRNNNPHNCFNWYERGDTARDRGEAASVRAMVEHVVRRHGIDPRRVFVTGLSAGGAMAASLMASYPEVFAAGAVVAGLPAGAAGGVGEAFEAMRGQQNRTPRAWGDLARGMSAGTSAGTSAGVAAGGTWPRVSVWHGDADKTVLSGNADALVAQWRDLHGLPEAPSERGGTGAHAWRLWRGSDGAALLEEHILAGMGHGVPLAPGEGEGLSGEAGPYHLDVGVDSTGMIAASWGLVAAPDAVRPAAEPSRSGAAEPRPPVVAGARRDGAEDALEGEILPPGSEEAPRPAGGEPAEPFWVDMAMRHIPEGPNRVVRQALVAAGLIRR